MSKNVYHFTSESVSEGHPDKVCDQVSDAVLDAVLTEDPNARVACECFAATGMLVVGGEVTTNSYIDITEVARQVIRDIGYTKGEYRFDAESCSVINVLNKQSEDIAMGVDTGGAGDQGIMFGYATRETEELMPAALMYSHKLLLKLAEIRKAKQIMTYLRPDSKAQITLEYGEDNKIIRAHNIVLSTQHDPGITSRQIQEDVINNVVNEIIPKEWLQDTEYHINPTGQFIIGGPHGDTGLTGRKIIVDTYGGKAPHGGGAFSGKDATKVDRSAAYAARYVAKNLVAAGVADECTIQLAYAIGVDRPLSIYVDTHGTSKHNRFEISEWIQKSVDLTPRGIIQKFDLTKPIFQKTASYGHFGRDIFSWESLDLVEQIKRELA
ncbi:MAG: methionine adenosyltransferase [Ignavibacteriae bacterium HGW-Ignavibacteriae-4]|jgi:S-adenosylmethionine synthetase|nr:MAG: methionine adenosyltransferase [Ignavibacteriae bacterium HGW-Ignavibacteriae-4]